MSTVTSVVAVATSLVASFSLNEKQMAIDSANAGYIGLGEPIQLMRNPNYNLLEIELPYIEYSDWITGKKFQFITGEGLITRVHATSGGWIMS